MGRYKLWWLFLSLLLGVGLFLLFKSSDEGLGQQSRQYTRETQQLIVRLGALSPSKSDGLVLHTKAQGFYALPDQIYEASFEVTNTLQKTRTVRLSLVVDPYDSSYLEWTPETTELRLDGLSTKQVSFQLKARKFQPHHRETLYASLQADLVL